MEPASPYYDRDAESPMDVGPTDDALLREVRNFLGSAGESPSAMTTGSPRHVHIDPHVSTLEGDVDWLDLPLGLGVLLEAVNHESILYHFPERELEVLPPSAFVTTTTPAAQGEASEGEAAPASGEVQADADGPVQDINEAMRLQGPARMIKYVCTLTSTMHLLPEDHFERLYQTGVQSRAASRRLAQQMIAERTEAELRTCTFKPTVSKGAAALPGYKGDLAEMYKVKKEWVEAREMKLDRERKKMAAEEKKELKEAQWKMNETSKQILEQAAARGVKLGGWEHLTQPRATSTRVRETVLSGAADMRSTSAGLPVDQHGAPFSPTTNYTQLRHVAQHLGTEGEGEDGFYTFTRLFDRPGLASEYMRDLRSETLDGSMASGEGAKDGPRAPRFVTRMELDAAQRKERAKERALIYAERQREKLYDPVTGQPLFEPNAPPTLVRPDGTRVTYAEMSLPERVLLERRCRRVRVSPFLPDQLHASVDGVEKRTQADHEGTVTRLLARHAEGRTHLERIRKSDERERRKLFKPELNPDSVKMLSGRIPVYDQPLPKKAPPPPPKPRPKADDRKVIRVAEDNAEFAANQKATRQRLAEQLQQERERDCRFRPALSEASRRMVEERNARLRVELASWESASEMRTPPSARQLYDARALSASAADWQCTALRPHLRQSASPQSRQPRPDAHLLTSSAEPAIEDLVDGMLGGVPPTAAQRPLEPQQQQRVGVDSFRDIPTVMSARGASSGSYREVSGFDALMDEWRELDDITSQALALGP